MSTVRFWLWSFVFVDQSEGWKNDAATERCPVGIVFEHGYDRYLRGLVYKYYLFVNR